MPLIAERSGFRRRLSMYLLGVSIGLVMLAMVWQGRRTSPPPGAGPAPAQESAP